MISRSVPPGQRPTSGSPHGDSGRRSHALESLTNYLKTQQGLQILDMGGINQANLDYITGLGHRLYSEDLIRAADTFFTAEEIATKSIRPDRLERFLDETFDFPDQSVDAALFWDSLQFLPADIGGAVLERAFRIMAPEAYLLAFFHPDNPTATATPHACRILPDGQLQLTPRQPKRALQPFNTRAIERFFHRFSSVKFFLSRENIQEVLSRR